MDDAQTDDSLHAATRERRVIEPDLLWIKGVTERLLGTAGRPASWERAYFEDAPDDDPEPPPAAAPRPSDPVDVPAFRPADPRQQLGTPTVPVEPVPEDAPAPQAEASPLPHREIRDFDGPIRYRQPPAYDPPSAAGSPAASSPGPRHAAPEPAPLAPATPTLPTASDPTTSEPTTPEPAASEPIGTWASDLYRYAAPLAGEPDPLTSPEPPPYDRPLAPQSPSEPPRPDDMPPAVLRAALRDALPDDLGVGGARSFGGPADAVFGDPRWNLPPDDEHAPVPGLGADDLAPSAPPAPPAPPAASAPVAPSAPADPGVTSYLPTAEEIRQPLAPQAAASPEGSLYAAALAEDLAHEHGAVPIAPAPPAPPTSPDPTPYFTTEPEPETPSASEPLPAEPAPTSVIAPDELLAAESAPAAPTAAPAEAPASAPTPAAPATAPAGSGFPRAAGDLEASDLALRQAFLSGDSALAEAVVRLIAEQGRDKQRVRTVLAYLDALLDGGGDALPGAARLRAILGDA